MKTCKRCRKKRADVVLSGVRFCSSCFIEYFEKQVQRAINGEKLGVQMFSKDDRILVAVSGGKDSMSLWNVLNDLGYETCGFHIDLGIDEYSEASRRVVENFAASKNLDLIVVDLRKEYGRSLFELAARDACSACGLVKRYLMNKVAHEENFSVLATGHTLDDECATLLGNLTRWNLEFLRRQHPVLESTHPKLVRKVKPLFRVTDEETAAYARIKQLNYVREKCPLARGATSLSYKNALNELERRHPGLKKAFYLGFLRNKALFGSDEGFELKECEACGMPTANVGRCAFCKLLERSEQ
ncbi:MAG: tRNA-lysidine synthase TilS/MesJ [Candidatus Alkanophagales archaeon MCA70_species_1]|nr:tRNA-lysidine synthase TilS/MesJ [Candidatus Alkanophaga volatiphilum]